MPRGTEHEPMAKLRRHDELKINFTKDELQELEDRARGWMRMDADVKIKLINGNRYALIQQQVIRDLWQALRECRSDLVFVERVANEKNPGSTNLSASILLADERIKEATKYL